MLWIITCTDHPDMQMVRERHLEDHRKYLTSQNSILILAGAKQTDDGTTPIGSLFIIQVSSRAEASQFSQADPFTQARIFSNIEITRMRKGAWNPIAAEGA